MKNPWMKKVEKNRMSPLDIMLHNQEIYNSIPAPFVKHKLKPADWDKTSLEIVKKIYKSSAFEFVSVQPMHGPTDVVAFNKFQYDKVEYDKWIKNACSDPSPICLVPQTEEVVAKTRTRKSRWSPNIAEDLATEIFREIAIDLKNNCGTIARCKWGQRDTIKECMYDVYSKITTVDNYIFRKTSVKPKSKWAIMSPEMASIFDTGKQPSSLTGLDIAGPCPHKAGILWNCWTVYVDPLFSKGHILIGHVTDGLCYFYNPYILLTHLEGDRIATRYSKKLPKEGAKCYGRIEVEDFQC
tara:strand:- start:41503 stop:42393 length:891 start_codon:yes stop_codon:yes gene_type:complete